MRVAALGDIHANLPALEAVLADVKKRRITDLWVLGDIIGYNAFPNEVVKLISDLATRAVLGNYDRKVLRFGDKAHEWERTKRAEKLFSFRWAHENLSLPNRRYLESLPPEIRLEIEGKRVLLTHGSPESSKEPLCAETPDSRLANLADQVQADVIVCAHSHAPFVRKIKRCTFINTGSVGLPTDGDVRACYATLTFSPDRLRVAHHRVDYDVNRAVEAIRSRGLPARFAEMVSAGRPWNEVGNDEDTIERERKENSLAPQRDSHLEEVLALARSCEYEVDHTHHVTRLALELFDALTSLHNYGGEERVLLEFASLLHDIGWIDGRSGHHKASLRRILSSSLLQLSMAERCAIGLIARYHRRALPSEKHEHFAALTATEQKRVSTLSSILRVADGLDRTHRSLIQSFSCTISEKEILLRCAAKWPAEMERQQALEKGQLLERVFQRSLAIEWYLS